MTSSAVASTLLGSLTLTTKESLFSRRRDITFPEDLYLQGHRSEKLKFKLLLQDTEN